MSEQSVTKRVEHKVSEVDQDGDVLYITIECPNRDNLTTYGRQLVERHVKDTANLGGWTRCGIESFSSPAPFDPEDESNNPYDSPKPNTKWYFKQVFKVSRFDL